MAKKKTKPKKEKFYESENFFTTMALSLPILTFLICWYVISSSHPSMDECMDSIPTTSGDYNVVSKIVQICRERQEVFFWPKALWWTVLIWGPIIGFINSIMDDKGYGDGIATAVGLFIGILVGGWILVVFIGLILKPVFY